MPRSPSIETPWRLASMGMKNTATASEASSEITTARPRSPNASPATPSTKTIGKKTAIEVSVEATTAPRTSSVPRMAAATRPSPSSRQRKIDSRTTIEESTSMPMPSARPPSDMTLSEMPSMLRGAKVMNREAGIDTATMAVERKLRRNR